MTAADLRCDRCGALCPAPAGSDLPGRKGVRLTYHPGAWSMKDDSGLLCEACAGSVRDAYGEPRDDVCAACGAAVEHARSVHVFLGAATKAWQLCASDGAAFLNTLRTVEPKLDPATLKLAGDWEARR